MISFLGFALLACSQVRAQEQAVSQPNTPPANGAMPLPAAVEEAVVQVSSEKNTSLVKVNVTSQAWNPRVPWQKVSPSARRGLGVILENLQILVTAQLVSDATYIELEQAETGQKLTAKVKAVDYEANLALLEPSFRNEDFFKDLKPVALDTSARLGDELQTWQVGRVGDLIISPLQVNKIQTARYFLETSHFLVYEAIGIIRAEGNSFTLPVMKNGKLAGMLLRYDSRNQSGTVLPALVIEHFLKDIADGNYEGFPSLGVEYQQTLDEQFRAYLGLKRGDPGVYIGGVIPGGSAEKLGLKEGDIIVKMNGHAIDARGDYKHPQFGTLNMSHIVRGASYVGDTLKVDIVRGQKPLVLEGKLTYKKADEYLIPPFMFDRGQNYLIQGGLVFQELTLPYLQAFGDDWANNAPLRLVFVANHTEDYEKAGQRKVVFLAAALPTRSTQGYERLGGQIVTEVNGQKVLDLKDVDAAFKKPKDGLHEVHFQEIPKVIYLDAFTAESDNIQLLGGAYRIDSLKRIE